MNIHFILNPRAGRGRDYGRLLSTIERRCVRGGIAATAIRCDELAQLDEIVATARASGVDALVAVGGDGTVHELGVRLIGTPIALGILPVGSGNGLARHLGISMDPVSALDGMADATIETIDTARVGESAFLGVAGIGFDAEVAHRFGTAGKRGLEAYVREAALLLRSYRPQRYTIEADGETRVWNALLVAVANSSQYGNEARIAPGASLRDGMLDICILEEPPLLAVPILLRRLFAGTLRDGKGVSIRRASSARVERAEPGRAHLDGEPVTLGATLRFEVVPQSLRVLVPRGRTI
ncbi:MAG TPA: diacylglycerol kinase family protein [Thermoanaerobaculia bacterium]|nr:diacylglycerol kinase family protein [Thermoanaerobaculia bacterium]